MSQKSPRAASWLADALLCTVISVAASACGEDAPTADPVTADATGAKDAGKVTDTGPKADAKVDAKIDATKISDADALPVDAASDAAPNDTIAPVDTPIVPDMAIGKEAVVAQDSDDTSEIDDSAQIDAPEATANDAPEPDQGVDQIDAELDIPKICVPTVPPQEECDGIDNDCNGQTDEFVCNDANLCTADSCEGDKCVHKPAFEGALCDDGDICTTGDACSNGACLGAVLPCPGTSCKPGKCDAKTGKCSVQTLADGSPCSDGDACSDNDTCSSGTCKSGGAKVCPPSNNPCGIAFCDNKAGCSLAAKPGNPPCDDGDACTKDDHCAGADCESTAITCDDKNPCTSDLCNKLIGCVHQINAAPCSDGNACTLFDTCKDGTCAPGDPLACDDNSACTIDSCDTKTGLCVYGTGKNGIACDDFNGCTLGETCSNGKCQGGVASVCDDKSICTTDSCDKVTGKCVFAPVAEGAICNDNSACTSNDACTKGVCTGKATVCDDKIACTTDTCNPVDGKCAFVKTPIGGACEDGNICTINDTCDVLGTCKAGIVNPCNDNNICTSDSCVLNACKNVAVAGFCEDGNPCTGGEVCALGKCGAGLEAIVTTFAGTGLLQFKDGKGIAASFYYPRGLAVDAAGTVYVADSTNHRIRKITLGGDVTTLAGSGSAAFADGVGNLASFNAPYAVVVNAAGIVFVADRSNHRIRKITPDGKVSTFVGGAPGYVDGKGTLAKFSSPSGIALDKNGWFWVADSGNQKIRRVSPDGNVTTLAGSIIGAADGKGVLAQFNAPLGIAADAVGNLYVADSGNHRIRKVATDGTVSTYAGTTLGWQDGAVAQARFSGPTAVAMGGDGSVFVADSGNQRLRKVFTNAVVSTVGGIGVAGSVDGGALSVARFYAPSGVAVAADGNLFVGDTTSNKIRHLSFLTASCSDGNPCTTDSCDAITGCKFAAMADKVVCGDANACTSGDACATGQCVGLAKKCDDGNVCTDDACEPLTGGCSASNAVGVDCDDGNLCTTGEYCSAGACTGVIGNVTTLAGSGVAGAADGAGAAATLNLPQQVALGVDGNLLVADSANNKIRKVTPSGTVTSFAGSINGYLDGTVDQARFSNPQGVAIASDGTVYVADTSNNRIRKIAGGVVSTLAGDGVAGVLDGPAAGARFSAPYGVAVDTQNNVYVADTANSRIRKIAAGVVTTFSGTGVAGFLDGASYVAKFNSPQGIAVDAQFNVWVGDTANQRVRKISQDGAVVTVAGTGAAGFLDGPAALSVVNAPGQIAMDGNGAAYVADRSNYRIRKIAAGVVSTVAGNGVSAFLDGPGTAASFALPSGVAVGIDGRILVGDASNYRIRQYKTIAKFCMDGNDCTADTCDAKTGSCVFTAVADKTPCVAGGNFCGVAQTCTSGKCAGGSAKSCDDKNACTDDSCDIKTGACNNALNPQCTKVRRVFLTSSTYSGALGGVAGANTLCQNIAIAKGLGGTWKAWLSDSVNYPAITFSQSSVPYQLISGEQIAKNWADLIDGTIGVPIWSDESGKVIAAASGGSCNSDGPKVWSNTTVTGTRFTTTTTATCLDWQTSSNSITYKALTGNASKSGATWTNNCVTDKCDITVPGHLYCFEQTDAAVPASNSYHANGKYFVSNSAVAGDFNKAGGYCSALLGKPAWVAGIAADLVDVEAGGTWNGNGTSTSVTENCSLYASAAALNKGFGVQGNYGACDQKRHVVCSTDAADCNAGPLNCNLWK